MVGITREDARRLFLVAGVPQLLYINKDRYQYKFPGEAAFIYWLFHWRQPSQTVMMDEQRFGFDHTTLGKVSLYNNFYSKSSYFKKLKLFTAMNKWNLETHGHRLHNLGYCAPRLSEFNTAIKQKIIAIGEAVPDAIRFCSFCAFLEDILLTADIISNGSIEASMPRSRKCLFH